MTDKIKLKADRFVNDKKLKLNYIKPKDLKILLAEFCEEQIAELKAECDLAIEGRDVKIKELETRCNELFLQTCEQAELIEKMKCCSNCKNEGDYKEPYRYGTGWCNICKRHKVAKGNFDKWEIKEK
jgi:hypothetical protein